ncbi:hypothetical protein F6W69_17890 [Microbacterium oxydans]|nr:hypothetical protein [Microbacterium oxydans]KAB1889893.1 hypothetical protein F6W69_17890 [Microbacterium oxydans]KTR76484.1 hypothetical protein NS234_10940 [Microbacterium oxydans]GED40288.1 hypothetical protein MOX01_34300 [Microbacterium oxydans]
MWETIRPGTDGYRLTIRATRVSMIQLVAIIVGCIIVGGGGAAAALIAISLETDVMFGRSGVVLVAGGLGIVIVLALLWIFAWRRKRYVIEWDDEGLRIVGAGSERSFPWESISRVLIRLDTDYARVEVRDTDDGSMTLLAGFGSQDVKRTNAMDPIPVGVTNLLRRHLLVEQRSKRNALGLHVFLRERRAVA